MTDLVPLDGLYNKHKRSTQPEFIILDDITEDKKVTPEQRVYFEEVILSSLKIPKEMFGRETIDIDYTEVKQDDSDTKRLS